MDFRAVDMKVVEMLGYYDPTQLNKESISLEESK